VRYGGTAGAQTLMPHCWIEPAVRHNDTLKERTRSDDYLVEHEAVLTPSGEEYADRLPAASTALTVT